MARIRTIKPEFWSSPDIGDLSRDARLALLGMMSFSPDGGVIENYIDRVVHRTVFPFDEDLTLGDFLVLVEELERHGLVRIHSNNQGSRRVKLIIVHWPYWQLIRRGSLSDDTVVRIISRDGWACRNCGSTCPALQVDHVFPVSRGGSNLIDNLQLLCPPCNGSKADHVMSQWVSAGGSARSKRKSTCRTRTCGHTSSPRADRLGVS